MGRGRQGGGQQGLGDWEGTTGRGRWKWGQWRGEDGEGGTMGAVGKEVGMGEVGRGWGGETGRGKREGEKGARGGWIFTDGYDEMPRGDIGYRID